MTRLLLFACLYLTGLIGWGQSVVRMDSLPANGVVLDKGWRWHSGDNLIWARPDFDDAHWPFIDPTNDIMDLPQVRRAAMGWLRVRLRITSAVAKESLVMLVQQAGASEIYVNGHLLQRFGQLPSQQSTRAYNPQELPVAFTTDQASLQTIAIRFAFDKKPLYTTSFAPQNKNPFFLITLNSLTHAVNNERGYEQHKIGFDYLKTGLFLILLILHLALYVYYPTQQTNLFIALFSLCSMVTYLLQALAGDIHQQVTLQLVRIAIGLLTAGFELLLVTSLYTLFKRPFDQPYWFLVAYGLACIPLTVWPYRLGLNYGHGLFGLLCFIEYIRITYSALRQKKHGSGLVMRGVVVAVLFLVIYLALLPYRSTLYDQLYLTHNPLYFGLLHLPYNISFLSIPIAISLYLGLEFGLTNQTLASKLVEIETLSAYTRQQEQEKQQILFTQNERLEQQVEARTAELKASQAQLIQKEKLASLGELTAGIAHEIQNPLNFVNNFAEVSTELVSELREEEARSEPDPTLIEELLNDLTQNLQKIHHHGGRASSIVKGMLAHSRTDSGEKRLTDLNALAGEYLQIAYHGWRRSGDPAKDKPDSADRFDCELVTDFDAKLGEVAVVPQEIGHVLLNLYTNAFYAVTERAKQPSNPTYQPRIKVRTQRLADQVVIQVQDNGTGIPDALKAKIFQPFFTTKPTGEGTGLGLSLSYDIITQGHGGSLMVESQLGVGSVFSIHLPQANGLA